MEIVTELVEFSDLKQSYRCTTVEMQQLEPYLHSHPEIELSLVLKGSGIRVVGDHIGKFTEYDLLLTSHNLPHDRVTEAVKSQALNLKSNKVAVVVLHLAHDFFTQLPDFDQLASIVDESQYGVLFNNPDNYLVTLIRQLPMQSGLSGLANVILIFEALKAHQDRETLSSVNFNEAFSADPNNHRLHQINDFVMNHYHESISQRQVAEMVAMSPQAFSRWFKQTMHCTFIEHLNKIRIEKSCLKLIKSRAPISNIALECGYESLSHFNRQFNRLKAMTPKAYRNQWQL